jgi:4-hydroxythreonine-4-phosphate dehydrogenase
MLGWFKAPPVFSATTLPIAFSMGEPAGIGSECLLKAWLRRAADKLPPFFVVGDPEHYERQAALLGLSVPVAIISTPAEAVSAFANALPVFTLRLKTQVDPGEVDLANASLVVESIRQATQFVLDGTASALVTLPIHKSTLYHSGFKFAGHTEYLAHLCNSTRATVMMLEAPQANPPLRVALGTVHVSLKDAIRTITTPLIVNNTVTVDKALRQMFGMAKPRLAVAALNPHAGENGALGLEEIEIIQPAIDQLRERGITVTGPHPPDTLFHAEARAQYDCAICLYHDQGLIPVKTLDFHGGINITLGLPIVRTSPDHGTAFDIAGKGKANPSSIIAALKRAELLSATLQKNKNAA